MSLFLYQHCLGQSSHWRRWRPLLARRWPRDILSIPRTQCSSHSSQVESPPPLPQGTWVAFYWRKPQAAFHYLPGISQKKSSIGRQASWIASQVERGNNYHFLSASQSTAITITTAGNQHSQGNSLSGSLLGEEGMRRGNLQSHSLSGRAKWGSEPVSDPKGSIPSPPRGLRCSRVWESNK